MSLEYPETGKNGFLFISPSNYRSDESSLYLSSCVPGRRVFLLVKGMIGKPNQQLRIAIRENDVKIAFPIDVARREDYTNTVYAYIGYSDMLTLSPMGISMGKNWRAW